jgi:hypothetical protein
MMMGIEQLLNRFAPYLAIVLLLFIVASVEYNMSVAIEIILKMGAFCLSMLLPILLSAKLAAFGMSATETSEKLLRLDLAGLLFISVQCILWIVGLHELQLYIASIAIGLFVVTLLIFIAIRFFG